MTYHAFLFESRSVQDFIFSGGKLRDVVAASNLLDQLTGERLADSDGSMLEDVLVSLGIEEKLTFSRRAGGAIYACSEDQEAVQTLAHIWPLLVSGVAPGLESLMVQSSGDNEFEAVLAGLNQLKVLRNFPAPYFPAVPPVAQRAQRTGEGAVILDSSEKLGLPDKVAEEIVSQSTRIKRLYAKNTATPQSEHVRRVLAAKFTPKAMFTLKPKSTPEKSGWPIWPKALSEDEYIKEEDVLPLHENNYMAMVHIDGNGLGQLLIKLNQVAKEAGEQYGKLYLAVSRAIANATQVAATNTVEVVLKPESGRTVEAIPLVLGGDDVTLIIAAKYAIAFTDTYITAFEHLSSQYLQEIRDDFANLPGVCEALPEKLTACGGIVFCKATYPFQYASQLAEDLCKKAKNTMGEVLSEAMAKPEGSKSEADKQAQHNLDQNNLDRHNLDQRDSAQQIKPSGVCWHKITTTSISTEDYIFQQELRCQLPEDRDGDGPQWLNLSLGTYVLDSEIQVLPNLEAFLDLQTLLLASGQDSSSDEGADDDQSRLGRVRAYLGYLKTNPVQAEQYLERLWEVDGGFMLQFQQGMQAIWPDREVSRELTYNTDSGCFSLLADLVASASLMTADE